jgi:hypothetical protein
MAKDGVVYTPAANGTFLNGIMPIFSAINVFLINARKPHRLACSNHFSRGPGLCSASESARGPGRVKTPASLAREEHLKAINRHLFDRLVGAQQNRWGYRKDVA